MDWLPTLVFLGFPCGSADKESTCSVGDLGSIPGGYPLQCSGLENSIDCILGLSCIVLMHFCSHQFFFFFNQVTVVVLRPVYTSFVVEKPILTPCWNCFFDLLFAAFIIVIMQNSLSQNPAPSV